VLVLGGWFGHAAEELAHCVTGARVHPEPAERGQRDDRRPFLRVRLDQQVAAVVISERKLRQADDDIPLMLLGVIGQARQRGADVLGLDRERLAHDLDVPGVGILTVGWSKVFHPACDLGRLGRVGHQTDVDARHRRGVPIGLARKRT
jgi:hypothetical protein